ncbi:MAG: glycosyltransferase family 2 protein [Patescibacteria group bacterium]
MATLEILMITHNRLEYLKKALPSVLAQDYKDWTLGIWDNNSDNEIVEWLKTIKHPKVVVYFHPTNESLARVTSEVFQRCSAEFVGKVDADMIIPPDWASRLIAKHKEGHFGFIGGFHFMPEDLEGLEPIIENGIWRKHHIGGNFIIRRADFKGYKGDGVMGLSEYQAEMGLPNGYLWNPILWTDHMEDFRSKNCIRSDEYNQRKLATRGITLEQYQDSIINHNYMKENTK